MIYLDNAATTYPKPGAVKQAMLSALNHCGNPGRGGHVMGKEADRILYQCRMELAELFHMADETQVIFTQNATYALNIAIKSLMHQGGHAVISGYEHNSVVRPLAQMANVTYDIAYSKLFDPQDAYTQITQKVREDTVCIIVNHISNVFGNVLPIEKIDDFCAARGIKLILDVSQSAGSIPIDVQQFKSVSFLCMPGHKGLYGPSGTGILLCCKGDELYSLVQGGTGSNSSEIAQPDFLPDMLESGTPNFVGIAGLLAGVRYVRQNGELAIANHKSQLIDLFYKATENQKKIKVFYDKAQKSLISFTAYDKNAQLFEELCNRNICLRSGMHCSPISHKSGETYDFGTIRVSFSNFNTRADVVNLVKNLNYILINL